VGVLVVVGVGVGVWVDVLVGEAVAVAVAFLVGVLVAVAVAAAKALTWRAWLKPTTTTTKAVRMTPRATPVIIQVVSLSNAGNNKSVSKTLNVILVPKLILRLR
jgi:hypothetical protein